MRVKAYQERERKRLEVRLQTRGLFCDEACTKSTKKKKKSANQPNDKEYLLIFTLAV